MEFQQDNLYKPDPPTSSVNPAITEERNQNFVTDDKPDVVLGSVNKEETTEILNWVALDSHMEDKSIGWYLALFFIAIVISGGFYLLTKDIITSSVIVICAIFLAIYAFKKPKELSYSIDNYGFRVGNKEYKFEYFRSFSIVSQNNHRSLMLAPLKRFSPYIFLSLEQNSGDKVIDIVSGTLPLEKNDNDLFEKFLRLIKL